MFVDDMDAAEDIKREDKEEDNPEENKNIITHKFEDYYADNFKKNEKGEIVQGGDDEEDEKEEGTNADEKKKAEQKPVEVDEDAFAGEDDLDAIPDDI